LCNHVTFPRDKARVSVCDFMLACFELLDGHQDARGEIDWFEASDDDRDLILLSNGQILMVTHHRADVTRCQETLDTIGGI